MTTPSTSPSTISLRRAMVRVIQPHGPSRRPSQTLFLDHTSPAVAAHSSSSTTYTIPAPPQLEYESAEAAEASIHEWTKDHSFNVSRSQLGRNANGQIRYRLFACVHARKPKNNWKIADADRQRLMATSKRDECGMRISSTTRRNTRFGRSPGQGWCSDG
ncbi:hypothetical protein PHYSODRAFT_304264 [Phytophthora sojae]|uniref:Uncharacterized protein n=1 Tax=Phytophthora sojae (strain P6497) TaxID=1094619 RepID=G4ZYB8_PHYSP|nr:hypothetical protein PHYSODRAFT_304264 [Phytophthora sojae]EGZ12730.1 hypothetical protein PHYSODRAFT_304264 [Phytophthora sojae]|eukprot:XP_009533063.1 hypothetical protein PHYSODRAFT_304264 [Phytophthora sojae]